MILVVEIVPPTMKLDVPHPDFECGATPRGFVSRAILQAEMQCDWLNKDYPFRSFARRFANPSSVQFFV